MDQTNNTEEISFSNVQVFDNELPHLSTLTYIPLEKNALKVNLLGTSLFYGVAIIILLFLTYVIEIEWLVTYKMWILCALILIALWSILYAYFAFFKKGYAVREKDIVYNSGLFWRKSVAIPFNRVQHCEVSIGPLERFFELSELKIYTAGGTSSDLSISGLSPHTSNRLKEFIVNKTGLDEEE